jgi:hypothetical protein
MIQDAHMRVLKRHTVAIESGAYRNGAVHRYPLGGGVFQIGLEHGLAGVLDQFPLLMAKLLEQYGEELRVKLLDELGQGQWIDQEHSVLGRNKHIRACRRLVTESSPDVHCQDGKWLMRASALDREIQRANRLMLESGKLPESVPPPMEPVAALPLAKTEPEESEDETGIYASGWLDRMRGAR